MKSTLLMAGLAAGGLMTASLIALADGDEHAGWFSHLRNDVAPVSNALYSRECGSCHFAYQPGLLTAASWERLMAGLDDHFGDNAELAADDRASIATYLAGNAANTSAVGRSPGIARSIGAAAPLRFTETAYFRRQHHELPARTVTGNPEVGSFGNCDVCHDGAARGNYDEHGVRIPGYGRWDD